MHAEAVLTALTVLETMHAELTLPLLCYAERWTGGRTPARGGALSRDRDPGPGVTRQPGRIGRG